jgi:hypothetical protein
LKLLLTSTIWQRLFEPLKTKVPGLRYDADGSWLALKVAGPSNVQSADLGKAYPAVLPLKARAGELGRLMLFRFLNLGYRVT